MNCGRGPSCARDVNQLSENTIQERESNMANNLTTPRNTEIDPYAEFGDEFGGLSHIHGDLLRFTKHGKYRAGQEQDEVEDGTRVLAYMPGLQKGYVKWQNQQPVKHVIGLVAEGFRPPEREELGDLDQDLWNELSGKKIDPWQYTAYIPMLDDTGQLYTYVTSSKGGLSMLSELSKKYAARRKMHPDDIPIIKLNSRSYDHPDYGETFAPVFKIDGWAKTPTDFDELHNVLVNGGGDDLAVLEDKTQAFPIKSAKSKPKAAAQPARGGKDKAPPKRGNRF